MIRDHLLGRQPSESILPYRTIPLRIGEDLEGGHQHVERPLLSGVVKAHSPAAVTDSAFEFNAPTHYLLAKWEGKHGLITSVGTRGELRRS